MVPESIGCIFNSCLFTIIVFLPLIGQAIETVMVFEDDHSMAGTLLWLVVIWVIPFIGPLMYLLFGQRTSRRGRVMFAQPSTTY